MNEDLKTFNINMSEDDIIKLTECQLKSFVKCKVRKTAFEELRKVQAGHIKLKHIEFSCLKGPQTYLTSNLLNNKIKSFLYILRSKSVKGIKDNFHMYYKG